MQCTGVGNAVLARRPRNWLVMVHRNRGGPGMAAGNFRVNSHRAILIHFSTERFAQVQAAASPSWAFIRRRGAPILRWEE